MAVWLQIDRMLCQAAEHFPYNRKESAINSLTDKEIIKASDGIDKALSTITRSNRGEVAFRILSVVRNLNDHIADKIWKDVRPDQQMAINKVASRFGNVRPYRRH